MIPEYLGAFNRAHPGIELNILSANTQAIADLMIGHEIDIALVEGLVDDRNLVSDPWRTDAMVLIAAPDHSFAKAKEPVGLDALAGETLIVREHGSGSLQAVTGALQARGIMPARTLEVGGTEAIKQMVAAGVGVAIVSAATIKDQVELGKLKIVELRDFSIERTLWQLKKPGRLQSPAVAAFEKLIRVAEGNPARNRS
jgi:DNA-binding transcriptional LysR family regulator